MPADLLDGKRIAGEIRSQVAESVRQLRSAGVRPGLAAVLVGDDPASAVYVSSKQRACGEAGMHSVLRNLPATLTEGELLAEVEELNADSEIHGILVQMPLPRHITPTRIIAAVDPRKDVDGFHPVNFGKLLAGDTSGFTPCTPAGIVELLRRTDVNTAGMHCVVVGRSNIVGKPVSALLMQDRDGGNATVTVCHSRTRDLAAHTRRADLLIAALGRPRAITRDMVKAGAVVIDVGVNRVADPATKSGYRLCGDVDFDGVRDVASLLTPVPGGVGPMTIAMLLVNTVKAARNLYDA